MRSPFPEYACAGHPAEREVDTEGCGYCAPNAEMMSSGQADRSTAEARVANAMLDDANKLVDDLLGVPGISRVLSHSGF